ncbi:hypothetical protein EON77_09215, partial [bacterium]
MSRYATRTLAMATLALAAQTLAARPSEACSPRQVPELPTVIPRAAATDVPLDTLLTGFDGDASSVVLHEGASVVPLGEPVAVEDGIQTYAQGPGWRRKPARALTPSTEYVVTARPRTGDGAADVEIARFHTGTRAASPPITSARPSELKLTRVHHKKESVGGGSCISAEYESFVSLK